MPQGVGWDSDDTWHKYHLKNVGPNDKVITKKTKDGVLLHLLLDENKIWHIQSIHFPKDSYSKESAKSWIKKKHTASVKRTQPQIEVNSTQLLVRLQNEVIGQQDVVDIEDEAQGYEDEWNSAWLLFRSRVDDVLNREDISKGVLLLGLFSVLNEWRNAGRRIHWDRMTDGFKVGYGGDVINRGRLAEVVLWQTYFFYNLVAQMHQRIQDSGLEKVTIESYLDSLDGRIGLYPRTGWQKSRLAGQRQRVMEQGMLQYKRVLSSKACPVCSSFPDVNEWTLISSPLFLFEPHPAGLCGFETKETRIFR